MGLLLVDSGAVLADIFGCWFIGSSVEPFELPTELICSTPKLQGAFTKLTSGLREFTLSFDKNVLAKFVELPEDALGAQVKPSPAAAGTEAGSVGGLWYSQILCRVIRGALEMVIYILCVYRILLVMLINIYWSLESHSGWYGRRSQICL
jgi:hypothetical protein